MPENTANSSQLLRRMNSGALMRFALGAGEFTAAEAMAATALTRSTVLGVCDDLVAAGWLEESADTRVAGLSSKGRPARRYRLREGAGVVVGLDAGEHRFTAAVADLRGTALRIGKATVDSHAVGPEGRVRAARELVDRVLADAGRQRQDVLLTVVGIPAPVDAAGLSPVGDGTLWPLMNAGFASGLDGAVVVENDANLAALAEHAAAGEEERVDTATLLTGERFGAGLIVDGRLLRGARGGAGELRLLDVIFPEDGAEATAGFGRLARRWARAAVRETDTPSVLRLLDAADISAEDVFHAASEGDAVALGIIDRLGARLARISVVLASLLDVDRVVVAGAIASAIEPVLVRAREVLAADFYPPVPDLVASSLGGEVVVRGALESALALIRREPLDFVPRR